MTFVLELLLRFAYYSVFMEEGKLKFQKSLGIHLKKIRLEKGVSGAELARRCFMEKQHIYRLETGGINPTLWYLAKICKGLDISLSELVEQFKYSIEE